MFNFLECLFSVVFQKRLLEPSTTFLKNPELPSPMDDVKSPAGHVVNSYRPYVIVLHNVVMPLMVDVCACLIGMLWFVR